MVAMGRALGCDATADIYDCVTRVLDEVEKGNRVDVVSSNAFYVHRSGVPGKPHIIAKVGAPKFIISTKIAYASLGHGERGSHWLDSAYERGAQVVPLAKALPFLIVGDDAWETRRSELPVGRATKYGRLGSAGSLWYLAVE